MTDLSTHGTICIPDGTGHLKITWDRNKHEEVAVARRTFDDMRKKGYYAYTVRSNGEQGSIIHSFNSHEEMIIFAEGLVGG